MYEEIEDLKEENSKLLQKINELEREIYETRELLWDKESRCQELEGRVRDEYID